MRLLVALADARDVARQFVRLRRMQVEVFSQGGAIPGDARAQFFQRGQRLDNLVDLGGSKGGLVAEAGEQDVLGAEFEQDAVELLVVVDVLLAFLALDPVEGVVARCRRSRAR